MVSSLLMLLRTKQSPSILHNVGSVGFFNGRSLFRSHHPKTQNSRIFMPVQMSIREFRVTNPRKAWNPILLVIHPYSGIYTIILALLVRRLWLKIGPKETGIIWAKSRKNLHRIGLVIGAVLILFGFVQVHETPITKRKRLIFLSEKAREVFLVAEEQKEIRRWSPLILPESHHLYNRARRVLEKIISANRRATEFKLPEFRLIVINAPGIVNALALQNGTIAVFTGMFQICRNNDLLAMVLSHELAHQMLDHYWEDVNRARFKRIMEEEADVIGIFLSATSCFDVREAVNLWNCLQGIQGYDIPKWLSTHPSYQKRVQDTHKLLPYALELRSLAGCPDLGMFWGFINKFFPT